MFTVCHYKVRLCHLILFSRSSQIVYLSEFFDSQERLGLGLLKKTGTVETLGKKLLYFQLCIG